MSLPFHVRRGNFAEKRSEIQMMAYDQIRAAGQEALARTVEKLLGGDIVAKAVAVREWHQQCLQNEKREALSAPVESFLRGCGLI